MDLAGFPLTSPMWSEHRHPKNNSPIRSLQFQNRFFQEFVEGTDATRFDNHIGIGALIDGLAYFFFCLGRANHAACVRNRIEIAMGLPVENIRFVEGDLVSASVKRLKNASIVGRGTVPISGKKARTEKADFHRTLGSDCRRSSHESEWLEDREELIDPMGAGVALADRFKSSGCEIFSEIFVVENGPKMVAHLAFVSGKEIIVRSEKFLAIIPRSRNQRNSAGHRLEHPNRRDACQFFRIRSSRNMDRCAIVGKDRRHFVVRKPAAEFDPGAIDRFPGLIWKTDAVNPCPNSRFRSRLEQEFLQLRFPLAIAPIPDPDQIAFETLLLPRIKSADIGGFMPRPDVFCPSVFQINLTNGFSEGQHAVVMRKIVSAHRFGIGYRSVMSIMKKEAEIAHLFAAIADFRHKIGVVPFVHDHEIGVAQDELEIQKSRMVNDALKARISISEIANG